MIQHGGSKKTEYDIEYLFSYRFFGMTKNQMDEIDEGDYIDENLPISPEDILWRFEDAFDEGGWDKVPDNMINQINYMSSLVRKGTTINKVFISPMTPPTLKLTKESVIDKIYSVSDYFDRPISAEKLLEVLFNVRKIQFYTNPDKFPFGLNEFCKTVFMSNWNFEGTPEENLLLEFTSTPKERGRIKVSQTVKYARETNIYINIQQVKLVKTLRRVYERKTK